MKILTKELDSRINMYPDNLLTLINCCELKTL